MSRGARAHWWRRLGTKEQGFHYVEADDTPIKDAARLQRIKALVIPPAWSDVRISPHPRSRLQALGLDGTGRPQYLYHEAYQARQERKKFEKIERFGEYLPRLRRATSQHIAQAGHSKERVLAIVTRLVNSLYFRAGSPRGVERHRTYGITTLRSRHVRVEDDGRLTFSFDGKHHVHHRRVFVDETIASAVRELKALGNPTLFQYLNGDGRYHPIRAEDLNEYLKALTAPEFSAKDFRTWHGTLIVAKELARIGKADSKKALKANVVEAVRRAAEQLGNTPAVCRRSYLHPLILELYERGITLEDVPLEARRIVAEQTGHQPEEMQLLELFHVGRVLAAQRAKKPLLTPAPVWNQAVPAAMAGPPAPTPEHA
ncbi:MAG: DNA topoisomerase IB [Euryarchaeota archaeon]|nr:DNA topoisomerase IB [Euryarchaeota archaeon]